MFLLVTFLFTVYCLLGYFFLKFLKWFLQDDDFIVMDRDSVFYKLLLWFLAILIWPSYLFDLGEKIVDKIEKS